MTTGLFLHISLAVFCVVLFLWLAVKLWKESREKPFSLLASLPLGAACCMIAFSVVSYLVIRTTLFDWTLQQDAESIRALRLYLFTGLVYLLAYTFSVPASDLFKNRVSPRALRTATLFVVTLFVLWSMAGDVIRALQG